MNRLLGEDPYAEKVATIISKVGIKPTNLDALHDRAKQRYAAKIPPGYADLKEKTEHDACGDFVGWAQIIEIAKAEQKPVILITDDAKEDWWQIQGDRTIGPRPELVAEFRSECGHGFYMYSSDRFMRFAGEFLKKTVRKDAIEEVVLRLKDQLKISLDLKPLAESSEKQTSTDSKPFGASNMDAFKSAATPAVDEAKSVGAPDTAKS